MVEPCYTYHVIRQSCQESSKEPADVGPGVGKPQKNLFSPNLESLPKSK